MGTIKTVEWDIGKDLHGRSVTLRQTVGTAGQYQFSIISEATSQRDEGEHIFSLTRANLNAIAEIEKGMK